MNNYEVTMKKTARRKTERVEHKSVEIIEGQYGQWKYPMKGQPYFEKCGGAVYVASVITDIDTCEESIEIYFDKQDDTRVRLILPKADFREAKMLNLTAYGIQVMKETVSVFIKSLENQEAQAKKIFKHEKLGFSEWQGESIFKGTVGIGADSIYKGDYAIEPTGNYKAWKKMVESEVLGQTPLEFILAVGASGLLVDFLKDTVSVENIICHLLGESSSGKTTSALLAVSCGSQGDTFGKNFVFNFQDTTNSLMKLISNSYPAVIDEGSLLTDRDMTPVLYGLSSGVERNRLTQKLEVREPSCFKTALILTSEKSILGQCKNNTGLLVRNFEFENVEWTKSAESADNIKATVKNHYGHVIPKVAKKILEIGREELAKRFKSEVINIIARAKEMKTYNKFTERVAKQSAIILLAVDMIKKALAIELDKERIVEFMEEHSLVKEQEQVSIGKRAMDWLMQYISKHHTQFLNEDIPRGVKDCCGRLSKTISVSLANGETSTLCLYVAEAEFSAILKEGGFSEKTTVLKDWRETGHLDAQKDRFISKIKVYGDIGIKGYKIHLPAEGESLVFVSNQNLGRYKEGEKPKTIMQQYLDEADAELDALFCVDEDNEDEESDGTVEAQMQGEEVDFEKYDYKEYGHFESENEDDYERYAYIEYGKFAS